MKASRIVSLLPSCTEIVCALGAGEFLKGRSHECDFPPEVSALPVCTSARLSREASSGEIDREVKSLLQRGISIYEVDVARLQELRPDLILTQAQCEVCAVTVSDLEKALASVVGLHPKIVSLSPLRLADIWKDIQTVADALEVPERGREVLSPLKNRVVDIIQKTCLITKRPSVVCLEWFDPLMAAGNWMPELVQIGGGDNLFGQAGVHSPWMEWEALQRSDPDIIVLMPCGFDMERTRREAKILEQNPIWKKLRAVKSKKVFVTDGNQYFNRPGPRLVDSMEILSAIIQPSLFSSPEAGKTWQKLI